MKNRNIPALAAALILLASPGLAKTARETQSCQAWKRRAPRYHGGPGGSQVAYCG